MSTLSPETTPPGDCSFTPSDSRLVFLLRRKIVGEPLPAAIAAHFHDTDIYTADPALLTMPFEPAPAKKGESGPWFFFTRVRPKSSSDSRKSRQVAGGVGTWHSERAPRRVLDDEGNCAGHSQYFSYKLKTGKKCSERTEWYMVEYSDDQEAGHHERVHGGEPQLVLCKIYKAHTQSRSGSGSSSRPSCSASARKRKAVAEASAPVKAKRRLFDSPAPASAVSLQEQVSSKGWIAGEVATSQGKLGDTSDCAVLTSKADGEAATSQGTIGDIADWISSMSKADGEAATSQGKMSGISDWFPLMSKRDGELATSQGKMSGISDWFPLMSKRDGEVATSQGKIGDTTDCIALMSKADGEAPTSQLKIGDTSDFSRFWPEPEATFDCGYSMTGGALPKAGGEAATSQLKIGETSDFSRFWPESESTFDWGCSMSGGALATLNNCSRASVRDVGDLFCGRDGWSSAFRTSDETTAFVWGMPSAPVLPPGEASWWSGTGSNGVWSC